MLIRDVNQITAEWLSEILKITVIDFTSEFLGESHGTKKWRLYLRTATTTAQLFLKTSKLSHEATFYQIIQKLEHNLAVVPCYDVVIECEDSHILLKDLSQSHDARPPSQLPPIGKECEMIVDSLADLHAYWWNQSQLETVFGGKSSANGLRKNIETNAEVFALFADFMGDRLSAHRREIFSLATEKLADALIRRYQENHFTLVFEDVHTGNFLYPRNESDKLYFIDWEQWGVNLAMNDLAYMMALFWSSERRSHLEKGYLQRYHQRLLENGIQGYSWDALWNDYRLCIIRHLFIPAWQWKAGSPPPDVWWNHLERICSAFEELNCHELLV